MGVNREPILQVGASLKPYMLSKPWSDIGVFNYSLVIIDVSMIDTGGIMR